MPSAPKTLTVIDDAVLTANAAHENRKHLGASVVGRECAREIWYKFRWTVKGQFDSRMLRLFNRGHREEPQFIRLLREAGIVVHQAGEFGDDNEAYRVTGHDGHFGGTPDAVLENVPDLPPDITALGEFKTFNDNQFKKLKEDRLQTAKWEYFVQMQIYQNFHELPVGLFVAVNKNDDELYLELVPTNPDIGKKYTARAGEIIYATEPPERINESPGFWKCRYCDFKDQCHHAYAPEINCRTCAYSAVGPAGSWVCARGRTEVGEQKGCDEHTYDPRFFDRWQVLDADFDKNLIKIKTSQGKIFLWGPQYQTSEEFKMDCDVPF